MICPLPAYFLPAALPISLTVPGQPGEKGSGLQVSFRLVPRFHCGACAAQLEFLQMIAICILVLSVAALIEFAVSQWRSMWMTVASQPLSDCLQTATGICADAITANDFDRLVTSNQQLRPAEQQGNLWLKEVKVYYRIVRVLDAVCANSVPGLSSWSKNELVSCARFVAAVLDQRLNQSLAYSSESVSN